MATVREDEGTAAFRAASRALTPIRAHGLPFSRKQALDQEGAC